jgi:osmotically-inducible protein OsmY
MKEQEAIGTELPDGVDLHPRHASWVRISTHNTLIGLVMFVVFAALFVVVIDLHLSGASLAVLGVFGALILLVSLYMSTPRGRRGFLGNAGLTARIKADLVTELGANHVNVNSSRGVVTLLGTVPYADIREAAEHLARRRGARQVINELQVVPTSVWQPDPYVQGLPAVTTSPGAPEVTSRPLAESVREALEDDPRVDAFVLVVRVEDGIAYLTGRQETVQASDAATEVAVHVPGILGVSSDIEVLPSC